MHPVYRDFPPPDLLWKYVDAYFSKIHLYIPLLHRPTFEQDVKDNLHLRDPRFAAVVLLVCVACCLVKRVERRLRRAVLTGTLIHKFVCIESTVVEVEEAEGSRVRADETLLH